MADEVVNQDANGVEPEQALPVTLEQQVAAAAHAVDDVPATDVSVDEAPADEVPLDEQTDGESQDEPAEEVAFSWEASEYVHHTKGPGWYFTLVVVVLVLVAAAAALHFWLEVGAFIVMAVAIVIYARKPPRVLLYELTSGGIRIDDRAFPYTQFRSFGVLPDEEWHTIDLEPTQRFRPRMSILFGPDDFESIVGHLELHLPRVDRRPDVVERLTQYLRF